MVENTSLIILAVLLGLSALFSASETAFYSVSKIKVKDLVQQKRKGSLALTRLKDNQKRLLTTILIGNNLVNIGASALATVITTQSFGLKGVGIATGVMTLLILTFGEIIPKSLATINSEKIALLLARPIELLMYLLYPVILVMENIIKYTHKLLGVEKEMPLITEQEIKTMIRLGAEEKVIERKEKELLESVLEFNDITASEVLTPRIKMFCLSETLTLQESLPIIIKEGFSRIPLFRSTKDKITGIVHVKDVIKGLQSKEALQLKDISQKPFFVSKETILSELFKEFQSKHMHMAIVVDEFGGTAGLVTLEDLLEEIVGEIMDEKDLSPTAIMRIDKNTIIVHGDTEIDKINNFLNVEIPIKKNYITISGFLHYLFKSIPKIGISKEYKDITFTVEEVVENKPFKIKIKKI